MEKSSRHHYDFWREMLSGHVEVGYLLLVVVILALYNFGCICALIFWPEEDVYMVPGVERSGSVQVTWGVPPPPDVSTNATLPALPVLPASLDMGVIPETIQETGAKVEADLMPKGVRPLKSAVPAKAPSTPGAAQEPRPSATKP